MWSAEERQSILDSPEFQNNNCPTYDVVKFINKNGASIPIDSLKKTKNLKVNSHKLWRHRMF